MNILNLILGLLVVVFVLGILHKLAVRRAKYLVEMELQSHATNPFADVILAAEPTQAVGTPEDAPLTRDALPPRRDDVASSKHLNPPVFVANRPEHATSL